jgi:hypothetical protein
MPHLHRNEEKRMTTTQPPLALIIDTSRTEDGKQMVDVRCPFCSRLHQHGQPDFTGGDDGTRASHCGRGDYRVVGDNDPDAILEAATSASEKFRAHIRTIDAARDTQPERLARARSDADEARGWSLIEEPFEAHCTTISALNTDDTVKLPTMIAKELWAARLAFDVLDAGEDFDAIDDVVSRFFTTVGGDTGLAAIVMAAALSTIAGVVVPQLLEEIEQHGSNWQARVSLAEARTNAWRDRAANHKGQA